MARILVVDDAPTQVADMIKALEEQGHQVILAMNGEEGVQQAKAELPDLIFMDIVMPGLNGFQATRQITHLDETRHIPVVLISSKDQETDKLWGERQGAKGYFVKPVNKKILMEILQEFLG
ncbi:MAG: response regulator [Gammaproteobacteria bacterium]|nr:response regulator [Gammaproteobacteria bacterium]